MKRLICSIILGLILTMGIMSINIKGVQAAIDLEDLDYNLNGIIDSEDYATLKANCGFKIGDSQWNPKYDINQDNKVNIFDIILMYKQIGSKPPILSDNTDITSKFIDGNFKNEVYSLIGKASSEPILYSEVKDIKELNVSRENISNLRGIEYFTSITKLNCGENQLTVLDVSRNTKLASLDLNINKLTSLDVSKNIALTFLNCSGNQLTTIDVSKNTSLSTFWCGSNKLTTIDVSKNASLSTFWCDWNPLTTIDVSKNIALTSFGCDGSKLSTIDVSKNTELAILYCSSNELTTIDVSNNIKLLQIWCYDNQLTTLDVSKNVELYELVCSDNQLTTIDVSKNTLLTAFWGDNNKLTTLDVSNSTKLTNLLCSNNQLTTLDVSKNIELFELDCRYNQLKTLYSIKDTWNESAYKTQYTDENKTEITEDLIITISEELGAETDITSKFTDENFKNEVYLLISKASSEPILYSDVKDIKELNVSKKNISSF